MSSSVASTYSSLALNSTQFSDLHICWSCCIVNLFIFVAVFFYCFSILNSSFISTRSSASSKVIVSYFVESTLPLFSCCTISSYLSSGTRGSRLPIIITRTTNIPKAINEYFFYFTHEQEILFRIKCIHPACSGNNLYNSLYQRAAIQFYRWQQA